MKRYNILLLFVCLAISAFSQADLQYHCTYGFTYEMSQQESWGYQKPVILSVYPMSAADEAGMQPNDIIEYINDRPTKGEKLEIIDEWMHDVNEDVIKITFSNLKEKNKTATLTKQCMFSNIITEKDIASSFAFYSLEDIQTRSFVCPFRTTTNTKEDIISYKTFNFYNTSNDNIELENTIRQSIKTALEDKGLTFSNNNPDLIIYSYYSYNDNQNYRANESNKRLKTACRYNVITNKMEEMPIYDDASVSNNQAAYTLNLGIRLVDTKQSTPTNLVIVWECEANELLKSNYGMDNYCKVHIPLMFKQFPFAKTKEYAKFLYTQMKYNYSGINYDINNLEKIIKVDDNSPAYNSGIRTGDRIEKVNSIKFEKKKKEIDERYKQFIYNTLEFRDFRTMYTNSYGFEKCAYWDKLKYPQVAEVFRSNMYLTQFSYLFYFEPFINPSETNVITFNIKREKEKLQFKVWPVVKQEQSFETIR
ncbi:hypothetical protein M2138_001492 [Dysgonomonadaceae bacterium PH5-43]|nr:hypothetical protein [Dysgonomonadaceae bacterium PH5-43]